MIEQSGIGRKRFQKFKNIPEINQVEIGRLLVEQLDSFELAVMDTRPKSNEEWARLLDESLTGSAKGWRDFTIVNHPGKYYYQRTVRRGVTDEDFQDYYRYLRAELILRAGVHLTNPGEWVKKDWTELSIPGDASYKDEVDSVIGNVALTYTRLVKYGIHVPGAARDEEKLVQDLSPHNHRAELHR